MTTVMLKSDRLCEEADRPPQKFVAAVGGPLDFPLGHHISLGHLTSGTGLSRGTVYFMRRGHDDKYELLGSIAEVEAPKAEVVATGWRKTVVAHEVALAEDLYPDLDIPGIISLAEELRRCATDSAAISRIVGRPVQVVHQAE